MWQQIGASGASFLFDSALGGSRAAWFVMSYEEVVVVVLLRCETRRSETVKRRG